MLIISQENFEKCENCDILDTFYKDLKILEIFIKSFNESVSFKKNTLCFTSMYYYGSNTF